MSHSLQNWMNQQHCRKCCSHNFWSHKLEKKDVIVLSISLEPDFDAITGDSTDWLVGDMNSCPSLVVS